MILIHLAVFLFGLAGLFGKGLNLPAVDIVWGRTFFAALSLALVFGLFPKSRQLPHPQHHHKTLLLLVLAGVILALHWITFFQAIQVSSVAVGLLGFSSFPVFVTFLEPLFFREKLRPFDLLTAALILTGLILITPTINLQNSITQGVLWGVLSGATFALLGIMNRQFATCYSPMSIAFCQNLTATIILTPFSAPHFSSFTPSQWFWLAILGIICTGLSHSLFIAGLRHTKTQLASLIAALEPIYGICFAAILFQEIPNGRILAGGTIIIATIALASLKKTSITKQ